MTAVCGGGTSSSRLGFGASVALTVPAIGALLNNIPTVWAVPFAAYLGLINYDLNQFCSADPPAVPNITAADAAALLTFLDPIGHTAALAKFQQLVGAYAWYQMCECDSVATPAPPAAPAPPAGLPQINPPQVGPPRPTGAPCVTAAFQGAHPNTDGNSTGVVPLPAGVTYGSVDFGSDVDRTTSGSFQGGIAWLNGAGGTLGTLFGAVNTTSKTTHQEGAPPAGTVAYRFSYGAVGGVAPVDFHWDFAYSLFCGTTPTAPGGPVPLPCPPDDFTLGLLSQILELVTLIQRQKVPFAYVPGVRHNGLTGNGQFAVSGIIGASVIITTLPNYLGNLAGDPPELFDVGFVTLGTVDGWHRSVRIEHSPTLVLPIEGSETLLGYSLSPGVVVDIQLLRREP